jgi:hypothetical protein
VSSEKFEKVEGNIVLTGSLDEMEFVAGTAGSGRRRVQCPEARGESRETWELSRRKILVWLHRQARHQQHKSPKNSNTSDKRSISRELSISTIDVLKTLC